MTFDLALLERRNLLDATMVDLSEDTPFGSEQPFPVVVCVLYGENDLGETPQLPPGMTLRDAGNPWFAQDFGGFGYLGSFFDSSKSAPTDYVVTVEWGDGTTSRGQVFESYHGGFDVFAIHAYRALGDFEFSVTITKESEPDLGLRIEGTAHVYEPGELFCPGPIILPDEMVPLATETESGEQTEPSAPRAPQPALVDVKTEGIASEVFADERRVAELDAPADDLGIG